LNDVKTIQIVGGGIAGLSTALALGQSGVTSHLYEQTAAFAEEGAGIGLGPNAVRRLKSWGVWDVLRVKGFIPSQLDVMDAHSGATLGGLPLANAFVQRYGAPYFTVHRADLHQALLDAVNVQGKTAIHLGHRLHQIQASISSINSQWQCTKGKIVQHTSHALIGADGINSKVRELTWSSPNLQASGHWAYRTLLPRHSLPAVWRGDAMGLWLGPRLHVVHYPVRGGEWLNVVVLVEASDATQLQDWDNHRGVLQTATDLNQALHGSCNRLQDLVRMGKSWRAWALFDRDPLQSTHDIAHGKLALLGDAAHPMLPYLAQGAGMAIEDADALAICWSQVGGSVELRLKSFAQSRWQRVAKVQARARRNAQLFHARGVLAWARNTAMRWGGATVMDIPWLYGG
jgi:salicylate hydroxylase